MTPVSESSTNVWTGRWLVAEKWTYIIFCKTSSARKLWWYWEVTELFLCLYTQDFVAASSFLPGCSNIMHSLCMNKLLAFCLCIQCLAPPPCWQPATWWHCLSLVLLELHQLCLCRLSLTTRGCAVTAVPCVTQCLLKGSLITCHHACNSLHSFWVNFPS